MTAKKNLEPMGNTIVSGIRNRNAKRAAQETTNTEVLKPTPSVTTPAPDPKPEPTPAPDPKPEPTPELMFNPTVSSIETGKKLTKRDTHKVYSFWAPKEEIAVWNCYQMASTSLPKREDLGLRAIREYIQNHPLTGDDLAVYELELKRDGLKESKYR